MDWKKPETPMVSSDPPPQIFYETTLRADRLGDLQPGQPRGIVPNKIGLATYNRGNHGRIVPNKIGLATQNRGNHGGIAPTKMKWTRLQWPIY